MQTKLNQLRTKALQALQSAQTPTDLQKAHTTYLGRKSPFTQILKTLKNLPPTQKKQIGQLANQIKQELLTTHLTAEKHLHQTRLTHLAQTEKQDPTQPGKKPKRGHHHPITTFITEITQTFTALGFSIADGPEIEDDYHNFEALNIPTHHPARDSQDTFFLTKHPSRLLRTQTSSMQIRWCENHTPPIRIIAPGKCYRKDELDATHSPIFHQFEGLLIDKNITLAHLKATLTTAFRTLLGEKTKFRFRTSYFPFVEPGLEVDATCTLCAGKGCRTCKNVGWIEILGCGMVHPNVLRAANIDPKKYTGFAFGGGIERSLMIRHQIPDIRYFYEGDLRFLHQFHTN